MPIDPIIPPASRPSKPKVVRPSTINSRVTLTEIRWLISRGRVAEAEAILSKYHGGDELGHPLVVREILEIQETIRLEKEVTHDGGWLSFLRTPGNRKRTAIGLMTGAWCQLNGTLVVDYYLTLMLDSVGITSATSQTLINACLQILRWITAITYVGSLTVTTAVNTNHSFFRGSQLVDRLGRRTLFLISTSGKLP